ncbi:MAG: hypothetical protein AB8B97_04610 [Granulosicoccus sp.]
MKFLSQLRGLTATLIVVWLATGCALTSPDATKQADGLSAPDGFDELVSRDVVSVLRQVERLAPASTTLGTSDASLQHGALANALKRELQSAGYATRAISAGAQTLQVTLHLERPDIGGVDEVSSGESPSPSTVTVTVGDVAVRRSYIAQADGTVVPTGPMQVRGVDASSLQLDNDIFSTPAAKEPEPELPAPPKTTIVAGEQVVDAKPISTTPVPPLIPLPERSNTRVELPAQTDADIATLPTITGNRPFLDLVAPSVATAQPRQPMDAMVERKTQNILELQQSNFESLFAEMGIVDEKVLTFANDSIRMGSVNKARLSELLQNFDPESDVLSVIGCSLGRTAYSGGQQALALGRAERVREELLYAGIPDSKILAEGCWADESLDARLPRRGVVVALKRPVS